ncbi:unnamed protein product [Chrysoparadoxa australica]
MTMPEAPELAAGQQRRWKEKQLKMLMKQDIKYRPVLDPAVPVLRPQLRRRLVKWMVDVAIFYGIPRDTVSIALSYYDRYTCITSVTDIVAQLVAFTAFFIACKMEEPAAIPLSVMLQASKGFTKEQVKKMEFTLLKSLHWNLRQGTLYDHLSALMGLLDWSHREQLELCCDLETLQDHSETALEMLQLDGAKPGVGALTQAVAALLHALQRKEYQGNLQLQNLVSNEVVTLYERDALMVRALCARVGFDDFDGVDACFQDLARITSTSQSKASSASASNGAATTATPLKQKVKAEDPRCDTPDGVTGIGIIEAQQEPSASKAKAAAAAALMHADVVQAHPRACRPSPGATPAKDAAVLDADVTARIDADLPRKRRAAALNHSADSGFSMRRKIKGEGIDLVERGCF